MLDNNWCIIDGFLFGDVSTIEKVLKTFLESDKKRILFKYYVFELDDCDGAEDYSKEQCIDEEFQYFKQKADASVDYDKISDEVKSLLYKEYSRLYKTCSELIKEDLYIKFLNDEIDFFDAEFIYSIKEFIARETLKPNKEIFDFVNERKVLENNINVSFTKNRPYVDEYEKRIKYVWYEPKSKEDLFNVLKNSSFSFSCIITEDVDNFNEYLYAFEILENRDFLLAINDRVGDFKSRILPKIEGFLCKENVVLNEEEYFEGLMKYYINDSDVD